MKNIFDSFCPGKQLSYDKNQYLFHQGDMVENLYYIETGQIRMLRLTLDGKETVMFEGGDQSNFAEASLYSVQYHCDALVVQDSQIIAYRKKDILELFDNNPQLSSNYMAQLARQIQQLRTHLELRNINSAHERIYHFLVLNTDSNAKVVLQDSLKDLAKQLGLAHETFYRALAKLEKNKLIHREATGEIFITSV